MSHGVQLPDLFNLLSGDEAQRELYQELEKIRSMSLGLLEKSRSQMAAELSSWFIEKSADADKPVQLAYVFITHQCAFYLRLTLN